MKSKFIKFTVSGAFITAVTYLLYLLLINYIDYKVTYIITYIIGIILSFFINGKIVFKSKLTIKKFLLYPLIYVVQITIGIALLIFIVDYLLLDKRIAPLLIIFIMFPVTFIMNKYLFKMN